jgi:alkane 1-monooxygenase
MNKLKYLSAFILAFTVSIALSKKGIYTYMPAVVAFGIIPLVELFFKPNNTNLNDLEKELAKKDPFFNWLLYAVVPIQIIGVCYFLIAIQEDLSTFELIGRISALGILCGIFGINIGHELGHRSNRFEQFLGEILLITSLESHFLPYHNSGHHYNVATPKDPATARKNEPVYFFWFRSQLGSYKQAWQIENKRLKKANKSVFTISNRMIVYTIVQIVLLISIYIIFDLKTLLAFIAAAIFGILMLETVNYIEHYALLRKKNENGKYERVQPYHSWNSNHIVGRTILFELSRHSDHHYKASKHYQLLDSLPNSPQMITGYPGMMLIALIPPLWFSLMNKRLHDFNKKLKAL